MNTKKKIRKCFVRDESCHWYIIPANKKKHWEKFMESEEAELGVLPDYAEMIDSPYDFEFEELFKSK